ncbi:MAG: 4'-phosphopantetheinyl transferase superfamily protein [Kiritimatiellae bacterium]|nr:4'-phosphopantetheinyl transferase superfamily protein [Kiritimatiellia bacterium]
MKENSTPIFLTREQGTYQAFFAWTDGQSYSDLLDTKKLFLHPHELTYFESLKFEKRQRDYLHGRYAAKCALSQILKESQLAKIGLVAGVFNQPIVQYKTLEAIGVSISHSDDMACALAYPEIHPLTIDIEKIDPKKTKTIKTQLVPHEIKNLALQADKSIQSTLLWTAKEALSKALKCGMMCPFELFETKNVDMYNGCYRGEFKNFGQYKFNAWIWNDFVICIALPKKTEMKFATNSLFAV